MSRIAEQTVGVRVWDDKSRRNVMVRMHIRIDVDRLAAHLAGKARKNRSGRSMLVSGAIAARIKEE